MDQALNTHSPLNPVELSKNTGMYQKALTTDWNHDSFISGFISLISICICSVDRHTSHTQSILLSVPSTTIVPVKPSHEPLTSTLYFVPYSHIPKKLLLPETLVIYMSVIILCENNLYGRIAERGSESLRYRQGGSGAQPTPEMGSGMVFWVIPTPICTLLST